MIINEIVVEATGVELITALTARKLLILGNSTRARKAPLPNPLYVYCTKMLLALESDGRIATTVSHRFAGMDREKPPSRDTGRILPFHFFDIPDCYLVTSAMPRQPD